jgi:hypothetical protein
MVDGKPYERWRREIMWDKHREVGEKWLKTRSTNFYSCMSGHVCLLSCISTLGLACPDMSMNWITRPRLSGQEIVQSGHAMIWDSWEGPPGHGSRQEPIAWPARTQNCPFQTPNLEIQFWMFSKCPISHILPNYSLN